MKHKYKKFITLGLGILASTFFYSCSSVSRSPSASNGSGFSNIPTNAPAKSEASSGALGPLLSKPSQYSERQSRPGLGTEWGREKESKTRFASFSRSSKPYGAIESIFYNDEEGLDAMIGKYRYGRKGLQRSENDLVEWGVKQVKTLKSYYRDGRRFVEGDNGRSYSIVIKNVCHTKIEAVVSVDGLDVLNGRAASIKNRGYTIAPGKTVEIKGFRTSEDAVAAFKFSSVSDSYSAEKYGSTRNVGVIGLAIFTEKGVDPWKWSTREVKNREDASPFAEAAL